MKILILVSLYNLRGVLKSFPIICLVFVLIFLHDFDTIVFAQEPKIEVVKSLRRGEKNFEILTWEGTTPVTLRAFHKFVNYPVKSSVKEKKLADGKRVETYSLRFKCYKGNGIVHDYTFNNDGFFNLFSSEQSKLNPEDEIGHGSMGAAFITMGKGVNPEPIYLKDIKGKIRQDEFHLRLADNSRLIVDGRTGCINWEKSYKENLTKIKAKEVNGKLNVESYPGNYIVFDHVAGDVLNTRNAQASIFFENTPIPCRVKSNSFRGSDYNEDLSPENISKVKKLCDSMKIKNEIISEGIQITNDSLPVQARSNSPGKRGRKSAGGR